MLLGSGLEDHHPTACAALLLLGVEVLIQSLH
jgi:hypothetical protein